MLIVKDNLNNRKKSVTEILLKTMQVQIKYIINYLFIN
jgi:hypothetical protein